jgi:hypothetical protein
MVLLDGNNPMVHSRLPDQAPVFQRRRDEDVPPRLVRAAMSLAPALSSEHSYDDLSLSFANVSIRVNQ